MAKKSKVLEYTIIGKVQIPAETPGEIEKTLAPIRKVIAAAGGTMQTPSVRTRSVAAATTGQAQETAAE